MTQKRLVIFSEDFPPYSGGIAQWAAGMATALAKSGHTITVFARFRMDYPAEPDQYPFDIHWVYGNHWRQLRTWYCYRAMRDFLLKQQSLDAIIATTWNTARGLLVLCRQYHIPLITVIHGLEVTRNMSRLKALWLKKTLLSCRFVIAVSRFTKQQVVNQYCIPDEHVQVLSNGVDPLIYTPDRNVDSLREKLSVQDDKVILTLARVIERKGHEQVIRALLKIRKAVPKIKYIIAGPWEETYYQHLKQLINRLDLNSYVYFTGYLATQVLADYYNLCDVYIMLSQTLESTGDTEGFGITYLEANACEKPVIGSDAGGIPDAVVHGETGYLVQSHNLDEIAARLIELLSNQELCRKLGKNGRKRIEHLYTWNAIAARMMNLLNNDFQQGKYSDDR